MSVDVMTEIVIERSVAVVSAYDHRPVQRPKMVSNIASVEWKSSPPARVGTTIEFVARFLGRRLVYTYEFIELVAGERLVMCTDQGPFPMQTSYEWAAVGEGSTRMTLRNQGEPSGFSRLMKPFMEPALRQANRKDLAKIKSILETG